MGAVITLCATIHLATAEDQSRELQNKLVAIRTGVQGAEADISRMKEEFNSLLARRHEVEQSLKKLKDEDRFLQKKIADLSERQMALETEVVVAEKRASQHQIKLRGRLKSMYINASVSTNPYLRGGTARGDLERVSLYSRKVRDYDASLFKGASEAVAALVASKAALTESVEAEKKLREQLQKKRKEAEAEAVKMRSLTEDLAQKQRQAQEALALLQGEAKKVEDMISSLTSGDKTEEEVLGVDDARESQPVSPEEAVLDKENNTDATLSPASTPRSTVLPSLFDTGLKISSPVRGEVLQAFGRSKLTNFADMVRSKGVEFSTPEGSDVHVVLDGKVAFAGAMPGYDQVVVVEHGARSYSLYGRMGRVGVRAGDSVKADQVIGTSSTHDEKGRNFYFEVRKNGKPINPESVLVNLSR
jgi:septal ring factor EnvC (AmiA/AmiB activator)